MVHCHFQSKHWRPALLGSWRHLHLLFRLFPIQRAYRMPKGRKRQWARGMRAKYQFQCRTLFIDYIHDEDKQINFSIMRESNQSTFPWDKCACAKHFPNLTGFLFTSTVLGTFFNLAHLSSAMTSGDDIRLKTKQGKLNHAMSYSGLCPILLYKQTRYIFKSFTQLPIPCWVAWASWHS